MYNEMKLNGVALQATLVFALGKFIHTQHFLPR